MPSAQTHLILAGTEAGPAAADTETELAAADTEAETEAETEADAETETETAVNVLDLLNGNTVPTHNPFAPKANSQFEGIPLLNVTPF